MENVERYNDMMDAPLVASPVPIAFESMEAADGYFHRGEQRIAIREGMSEIQIISAAVHEVTHAQLHNDKPGKQNSAVDREVPVRGKSRFMKEVEAESVAYVVCSYY